MTIMAWWWLGFSPLRAKLAIVRMRFSVSSRHGLVLGFPIFWSWRPNFWWRTVRSSLIGFASPRAKAKGRAQVRAILRSLGGRARRATGNAKRLMRGLRWLLARLRLWMALRCLLAFLLGFSGILLPCFLYCMFGSLLWSFLGCTFVIFAAHGAPFFLPGGGCSRFFIGLDQWFFKCLPTLQLQL